MDQHDMSQKVVCAECEWRGPLSAVDHVDDPRPHPGAAADRWQVCPQCRTPEQIRVACEADGCWREVTCGMRHQDGIYRHTCSSHAPRS